jgi:hypothetical protein
MSPEGRRGLTLIIGGVAALLLQIAILVILLTHKLPMAALSLFLAGPAILVLIGIYLRRGPRGQTTLSQAQDVDLGRPRRSGQSPLSPLSAAAKTDKKPQAGETHLDSR